MSSLFGARTTSTHRSCSRLLALNPRHIKRPSHHQKTARPSLPSSQRRASTAIHTERVSATTQHSSSSIRQLISIQQDDIGGDQFWADRLQEALVDLRPRKTRVTIYGDPLAAPEDVVTAVLQTPFSDTSDLTAFVSQRQDSTLSDVLKFGFRSDLERDGSHLGVPSGWLQQSGADLYEITGSNPLPHLLRSDVIVLVLDPYRLIEVPHIRDLPPAMLARSIFVVNGHLPPAQTKESISASLKKALKTPFNGEIVFTNASSAIEAYNILQSGGASPPSQTVEAFQSKFLSSGMGNVQAVLMETAKRGTTSELLLQLAIDDIRSTVDSDINKAEIMRRTVNELRRAAQKAATRARHLSVANMRIDGGRIEGSIGTSKDESAAGIRKLFQTQLNWLSIFLRLRVDEVAAQLDREASRVFSDVEQQLVFEAGELHQIQEYLSIKADKVIRATDSPFKSAVLTNRLSTLSLSIPAVTADALLDPIRRRRQQLQSEIIPLIHARARWMTYQTYLGAGGGVAASWTAFVPPFELISSSTAIGLGLLSVAASIWAGQTQWLRSQKVFWRSWDRSMDLLSSDIRVSAHQYCADHADCLLVCGGCVGDFQADRGCGRIGNSGGQENCYFGGNPHPHRQLIAVKGRLCRDRRKRDDAQTHLRDAGAVAGGAESRWKCQHVYARTHPTQLGVVRKDLPMLFDEMAMMRYV